MLKKSCAVFAAGLMAAAMWIWVQRIAIPHQQSESVAKGIPRGNLSDLYPRWLGARELLLHGRDPYGSDITREIQTGYYGRPIDPERPNDPKDQQAFAYPLYIVFVLAPAVGLPFPIVQRMFLWLLVLLTAASVPLWQRALGWRLSTAWQLVWIVLVTGCFPAIQGFKLQQLTLLVAALVAVSLCCVVRRRLVWAGALLAIACIKPQLVVLVIVWLCLWVAGNWKERQRLLWSFAAAITMLVIGGEFLLPGWIREFRAASAAYYLYTGGGRSVLDVALTPLWGRAFSVMLVGTVFVLLWQIRHAAAETAEFRWALSLVMATTLVVVPMFAPYNQLLLVPALLWILQGMQPLWTRNLLSRFLIMLTAFAVIWPWLAAGTLAVSLVFLPASVVEKAWALPLYTSLAIPVTTVATLLAGRSLLPTKSAVHAPVSRAESLR
jgi:glycosyl transferase family 87